MDTPPHNPAAVFLPALEQDDGPVKQIPLHSQSVSLTQLDGEHTCEYGTVVFTATQEAPEQFLTVQSLVKGVGVGVMGLLHLQLEKDPADMQSVLTKLSQHGPVPFATVPPSLTQERGVLTAIGVLLGDGIGVGVWVGAVLPQSPSFTQFEDGQALAYATISALELHEFPLHVLTVHSLVDGVGVVTVGGFAHLQYEKEP